MNPTRDPSQPDPALPGDPRSAVSVAPVDLAGVLEALRVSLAQAVRHPVVVGVPDGRQSGIYVWPWRFGVDDTVRAPIPPGPGPGGPPRTSVRKVVDILVLVEPATGADWLALLDGALGALHDSPVLTVGATTASIVLTQLSANDLGAIFEASGVRLLPVVSASIRLASA
jgi:hypothetical protein